MSFYDAAKGLTAGSVVQLTKGLCGGFLYSQLVSEINPRTAAMAFSIALVTLNIFNVCNQWVSEGSGDPIGNGINAAGGNAMIMLTSTIAFKNLNLISEFTAQAFSAMIILKFAYDFSLMWVFVSNQPHAYIP